MEPRVSLFMLENPNIVDELKIIGEVDIQLREDKQQYFLTGSWYQVCSNEDRLIADLFS